MKLARTLALAVVAAALATGAATAATATPKVTEAGGATYPEHSYILTLPKAKLLAPSDVSVTENGSPVTGLQVQQQGVGGSPTTVVLAIDASASMAGRPIEDAVAAARAFVAQMNPNEQIALIAFNNNVNVIQKFTSDKNKLADALASTPKLAVGTKINDALAESLTLIDATGAPNGSVVLLSDGTDVGSTASHKSVADDLKTGHVRVFSVGLVSQSFNKKGLDSFATASHGHFVEVDDPSQLTPIFEGLRERLASEYLLSYRTKVNPSEAVKVRIAVKGFPTVTTHYTTPKLHIVPAKPYTPSAVSNVLQSSWVMAIVVLAFALLLGFAVAYAFSNRNAPLVSRVGDFVSVQGARPSRAETAEQKSESKVFRGILSKMKTRRESSWSSRFADTLEIAGINAAPMHIVVMTLLGTVVLMFVLGTLFGAVGVILGLLTPLAVRFYIRRRVSKTRKQFADQLPDNLDVLASALRAGHSLVCALAVVADDAPEPSKTEFRRVLAEEQFGVPLENALRTTSERMQNVDIEQVGLVSRLQREMGSNSAEVLDKVIETVRGRMELRRLVRTLTAQGRFSRWVLTALPIALAIMLELISPGYMQPLFHTVAGQALLVLTAVMIALGSWIIGKIVDIRV